MVKDILEPVGRMDGDSLPVSVFMPHVDGQFELGAAAYEKRVMALSLARQASTHTPQPMQSRGLTPMA